MRKLYIILPSFRLGGVERWALNVCQAAKAEGWDPILLTFKEPTEGVKFDTNVTVIPRKFRFFDLVDIVLRKRGVVALTARMFAWKQQFI